MEIVRDGKLTFGAYLLFAKEYCSISDIQIGRFKSEITIIDSISLDTDLFRDLYGGVSIADLLSNNYTSKSRNKLVAKAFKEIGLIERYGSGIKRILNICFDYGVIAPTFEVIHQGLKVVVFKKKLKNDTLNERQKKY